MWIIYLMLSIGIGLIIYKVVKGDTDNVIDKLEENDNIIEDEYLAILANEYENLL